MTETIKNKLEFPHYFVRIQAIEQLQTSARHKLKTGQKLISELDILWQKCCESNDSNTACACANAIVTLAREGLLDGNKVVSTAVNFSSHAPCISWLLHIIGQLLKLDVLKQVQSCNDAVLYRCPYNFRSPPHPFISILSSSPNAWHLVVLQIENLLQIDIDNSDTNLLNGMFAILKPIILYILLNPSTANEVDLCRFRLLTCLFEIIMNEDERDQKLEFKKTIFHVLEYHDPTANTLTFYEKAAELNEKNMMLLLKILRFCITTSDACNKLIAMRMLRRMTKDCHFGTVEFELILVAIARFLKTQPVIVLFDVLCWIQSFMELIEDVSSMIVDMLRLTLLQLQLLCSMNLIEPKTKNLLRKVFTSLEEKQSNVANKAFKSSSSEYCILDNYGNEVLSFAITLERISSDPLLWLNSIENLLANNSVDKSDISNITHLLLTLLLNTAKLDIGDEYVSNVFSHTLNCLMKLADANPQCSYSILPVYIYLIKCSDMIIVHRVFYALPSLANHPYCVSPILNILKSMSSSPSLKPLALRLLINVWKNQDRCYPHIQTMISGDVNSIWKKDDNYDFHFVKGLAICTICKYRPHQYGSDMLKLINRLIMTPGQGKCHIGMVSLALEALYFLCESKVLNLKTMWDEVGPHLQKQTEALICAGVLKLLSLVPSFMTDSQEYETFLGITLPWVWNKLNSTDDISIVDAALQSLSHFDYLNFKVKHFPSSLRPQKSDEISEEEYLEKPVPGSCFGKLLLTVNSKNFESFQKLSSSILKQELKSLPRDIHHRAMKSQLQASQPKPLKAIPEFIVNFYERNKQPAMKASLASSLLLCYRSSPELDSSGNPLPKSLVSQGRKVIDILKALLKEVFIEPNNWQSLLWCAHGWKVFMKRCVNIVIVGRLAELNMQKLRDDGDSTEAQEELEQKINTVNLWCRDKIMNVLKAASKGNPSSQGNAVFALAALIIATNTGENDMNEENTAETKIDTEFLKMSHWTTMAIDTLMSIANPKHIPSGRIMSWCQYRAVSSTGKLSTTQLGKICAIHALPFITLVTMQKHSGKVLEMLAFLRKTNLSEEGITFHSFLALGHILSVIYHENLNDQFTNDGVLLIQKCLEMLYENLNNILKNNDKQLQDNLGCLLGFGLAFSSKLQSSDPSFNVAGKEVIFKLKESLKNEDHSPECAQTLATILTWTHLSAFSNGIFANDEVNSLVDILHTVVDENPSKSGLSESLGTLCNGIFLFGEGSISETMNSLFSKWYANLSKGQIPTREKLASITGISALVGANSTLSPVAVDPSMLGSSQYLSKLSGVVKSLRLLARNSDDPGVPTKATILLGHLYMSLESNSSTIGSILPPSYEYLPHTSILKCLYNLCIEAIKPDNVMKGDILDVIMRVISQNSWDFKLPPVNWTSVLSPLLLGSYSETTINSVISILLSQCNHSSACSSLLSIWISMKKFESIPSSAQALIYQNLDKVIRCQEDLKIADFLELIATRCIDMPWNSDQFQVMRVAIIDGLTKSLRQSSALASGINDMLYNTVEGLFMNLPFMCDNKRHIDVLRKLSECIECLPDANALLSNYEVENALSRNLLKCLFIRCCCTLTGTHPLNMCNNTILKCGKDESIRNESLWIIGQCLCGIGRKEQVHSQIEWLQELMGEIKKIVKSSEKLYHGLLDYCIDILSMAVAFWSTAGSSLPIMGHYKNSYMILKVQSTCLNDCKHMFPLSLSMLYKSEKWENLIKHMTDWLIMILQKVNVIGSMQSWEQPFRGALYAAVNTKGYQLPSVWCKVVTAIVKPMLRQDN
uniref:focadhesin-like n=1 Tax=Styela clava TaxID=7725 RepID=UPI00193ADE64|nr:focadhesin-like [Styela clava]